jgi:hypothetical protein
LLIAVLLAALIPGQALSEPPLDRLHYLIVADTLDAKLRRSIEKDLENVTNLLVSGIPSKRLDGTILMWESGGNKVTKSDIRRYFDQLTLPSDACLFVYYSGHGANDRQTGEHVLTLKNGDMIRRTELLSWMRAKKAGLYVLLTDCCSNEMNLPSSLIADREGVPRKVPKGDQITPVLEHLFFRHRGLVDITAAQDGASALCNPYLGGFFTHSLCEALYNFDSRQFRSATELTGGGQHVTWSVVHQKVREGTNSKFQAAKERNPSELRDQTEQIPKAFGELPGIRPGGGYALGVTVALDPQQRGVVIVTTHDDTPASRAGFEKGDVITKINGKSITSLSEFTDAIDQSDGSVTIDLIDRRTGKAISEKIRLERKK